MASFCVDVTTPQIEILRVGCVFYSIAVWEVFEYYYDPEMGRFPDLNELPALDDGVPFADVIRKCWKGEYASVHALRRDVDGSVSVLE